MGGSSAGWQQHATEAGPSGRFPLPTIPRAVRKPLPDLCYNHARCGRNLTFAERHSMITDDGDAEFERHWAAMPEGKLELIDGKLIISTLSGSRWIMREILKDYGPDIVLPMAPPTLWWSALREA